MRHTMLTHKRSLSDSKHLLVAIVAIVAIGSIALASGVALSESKPSTPSASTDESAIYVPPKKLTPRARVGGQLRGTEGTDPEVQVLVPDHVGLTGNKTPVLNWFISKPTKHEVRFTLVDNKLIRPLYEAPIEAPKQTGIYSIQIKDLGLKLEPGVQYRWYVSVIRDADSPSQDIVGGGVIESCELNDCIVEMGYKVGCSKQIVIENAKGGFWYDAMGCLCSLIDTNPTDPSLRRMRAGMLKQVGLNGVAEWDLRIIQAQTK